MTAAKPTDDLEAVRLVTEAVKDFNEDEQKRIFRWAAEKLGLPPPFGAATVPPVQAHHPSPALAARAPAQTPAAPSSTAGGAQDIKSFVADKSPRSDVQFAATVAYYFQFEAPPSERKDSINGKDLQDACRKVGRQRLKHPGQTLRNAHNLGLLDKAVEAGHFSVNTVGENLVAMTLPGDSNSTGKAAKRAKKRRSKRSAKKKAARKPRTA